MKHRHRPKLSSVAEGLFEYRGIEKERLKLAMLVTFTVMILEIVGGFLTNSLALLGDAGHMFTHLFALLISFFAILCASKKECHHRTFGFYRAEILAALFNSLFLFVVSAWIIFEGIKRIINPSPVLTFQMFIIALIGLLANLVSAAILKKASRDDLNVRGAFFHLLADTLSSLVIVGGAIVIYFTDWMIIDPILSLGLAGVILWWGWGIFKDSINILLEGTPKGIDSQEVAEVIKKAIPQIEEITDLHLWEITSKMYSLTAHIKFRKEFEKGKIKDFLTRIKQTLNERFDIEHTTIEVE